MLEKKLFSEVENILKANLVTGHSKSKDTDFTFIKPSKNHYKFQYFWDCCFHVFILCSLDKTDIAKKCLTSLFAMQSDNGFVGHIHYWNNVLPARFTDFFQNRVSIGVNLLRSHMSSLIQPPFVALALQRIYECGGDEDYLREMLPKVKKYFDWLDNKRDFDDDGLLTIITSFESGMDWKPSYDEVVNFNDGKANGKLFFKMIWVDFCNYIRNYDNEKIKELNKFRVKDAGFNTIYYLNLVALSEMCETVGDTKNATKYLKRSKKVKLNIEKLMFDEKDAAFYDVHSKENKKLKTLTPTIFFPLAIPEIFEKFGERVMQKHYFNKKEFYTQYPIPSVAIKNKTFNAEKSIYLWRGPTWILNNWFLHKYILKKHYPEEANRIVNTVKALINKSGFLEYYNPFTGEGYSVKNFTWSGLVVDMINSE